MALPQLLGEHLGAHLLLLAPEAVQPLVVGRRAELRFAGLVENVISNEPVLAQQLLCLLVFHVLVVAVDLGLDIKEAVAARLLRPPPVLLILIVFLVFLLVFFFFLLVLLVLFVALFSGTIILFLFYVVRHGGRGISRGRRLWHLRSRLVPGRCRMDGLRCVRGRVALLCLHRRRRDEPRWLGAAG